MDLFRPVAAVLAGCVVFCGLTGCRVSAGKPVIWLLRDQPETSRLRELDAPKPVEAAEYKSVGEYPIPSANSGDSRNPVAASSASDALPKSQSHRPPKVRGLFGNRTAHVENEEVAAQEEPGRNLVSEPVETQQKLVPQSERKPGFWERIGNGFRSMTDLARGQRPVHALAVLPFKPGAKNEDAKEAEDSDTPKFHIPAFTLQGRESIAQATALDDSPAPPASDLVSHWSEFPASPEGNASDAPPADSVVSPRGTPQTTALP